jgi:hypothetical protein
MAGEQTIEEAWATLPEGAKLNARALALATFWRWRCCHIPCTPGNPCGGCAERVAIIERLGR